MKEFLMRLTWVDYVAAAAVLRGLYVGYREGIFPEILRIASYMVSILVAFYFYERVADLITLKSFFNNSTAIVIAFTGLLVGSFLITLLIRVILLKMLKVGEGGFFLRSIGGVFGGLRWLILLSFVFMLVDHSPMAQLKKDIHARSVVGEQISQAGPMIFDFMAHFSPQLGLPNRKIG